jgi:hypothetical protein
VIIPVILGCQCQHTIVFDDELSRLAKIMNCILIYFLFNAIIRLQFAIFGSYIQIIKDSDMPIAQS